LIYFCICDFLTTEIGKIL